LGLLIGASLTAVGTTNDGVVDSLEELRDLYTEHQNNWVELALPGDEVLVQNYGLVVPFRPEALPKKFIKRLVGEYGANGIPEYKIVCYEDGFTREVVLCDAEYGTELWRLDADPYHDPYAVLRSKYDLSATDSLAGIDPFEVYRLDTAKVAATFTLVPDAFYADYVIAEEQARLDTVSMTAMTMSVAEEITEPVITFSLQTNANMLLDIELPLSFGSAAEIFSTYNLVYVDFSLAENRLSCTGGTHVTWSTTQPPYSDSAFLLSPISTPIRMETDTRMSARKS
jgi:hypothetical protein